MGWGGILRHSALVVKPGPVQGMLCPDRPRVEVFTSPLEWLKET